MSKPPSKPRADAPAAGRGGGAGADAAAPAPAAGAAVPRGTGGPEVVELPLKEVHPNPTQPRRVFNEEGLKALAESLKAEGLIQPVTVRSRPAGGYELVAGERRWRAAGLAGLKTLTAIVRPLNDGDTARWALIENVQREDLNPIERAEAVQGLCDAQGLSHAEVGRVVGLSRPMVSNLLRLLSLAPAVREMVVGGLLRMGHARAVTGVADPAVQEELARRCVAEGWSVRTLEQAVQKAAGAAAATPARPRKDAPEVRAAWLRDLESQLSAGLETPVRVAPGRKRGTGTVTLEYRSLEDFDRLVERLGVRTG